MGTGQDPKCFGFSLETASKVVANLGAASCYGQTTQLTVPPSDSLFVSVQASGTSPGIRDPRLCTTSVEHPEFMQTPSWLLTPPTPLDQYLPHKGSLAIRGWA